MNPSNAKNTKPTDTTTSEPTKPVEAPPVAGKPSDTKSAETPAPAAIQKDTKSGKTEKTHVVSTVFDARTAKKLKLLASVENVSVASIVISAVTKAVNKRLPAALEAIKSDLEG